MRTILLISLFIWLSSCTNNNSSESSEKSISKTEEERITQKDSPSTIKLKMIRSAELDGMEFGELMLFDDFFNDLITKYFIKYPNSEFRVLTVIVYKEKLRYIKRHVKHYDIISQEEINETIIKINEMVNNNVEKGFYIIVDKNYVKSVDFGETWYNAYTYSICEESSTASFWAIVSPELSYLKHMINSVIKSEKDCSYDLIIGK